MKPFKTCNGCKAHLYAHKVQWLKKVMIRERIILKLFNCPDCNSTSSIKVIRGGN